MRRAEPVLNEFAWRDVLALLATASLIGGIVIGWVKYRLAGDFASKSDIAGLSGRIESVEQQMVTMPTRSDMQRVTERVGALEKEVAVVGTEVRAVRDSVALIQQDLRFLVNHQIKSGG